MITIENDIKKMRTPEFNYNFNLKTGYMETWGHNENDDPQICVYGPLIADIEITTVCAGISKHKKQDGSIDFTKALTCNYCYKSNTKIGNNMSFDTFKKVIENINYNNQLTQVAFGLGSTGEENQDLWKMCEYLRSINVIPNGTVAQISEETAEKIAKNFGGVAVSAHIRKIKKYYRRLMNYDWEEISENEYNIDINEYEYKQEIESDFDVLADSVEKLVRNSKKENAVLRQVNCHFVLAKETLDDCYKLFELIKTDKRFESLNAIVLLGLKQCGRAKKGFNKVSNEEFQLIVETAFIKKISIGFDSCSANKFTQAINNICISKLNIILNESNTNQTNKEKQKEVLDIMSFHKQMNMLAEPCESGVMSSYVDVHGKYMPCSFCSGSDFFKDWLGVNLLKESFKDLWENKSTDKVEQFRKMLLDNKRSCPIYDV